MRHARKEAIKHLLDTIEGVKINSNNLTSITINYEVCSMSKVYYLISY